MPRRSMLLFLVVLLISAMGVSHAFTKDQYQDEMRTFSQILYQVMDSYVTEVDSKKLFAGAYRGMLSSLDPYSQYFDVQENKSFRAGTEGEFGGVGIEINMQDGVLTVVSPIKGTPAYDAGILPGDLILKINGKSTERISLEEAVNTLRGEIGTKVTITVRHLGAPADNVMELTRAKIAPSSAEAEMIDAADGIGYMRIGSFTNQVMKDFDACIADLQKKEMRGLVLDLRGNPGGLLEMAVEMSDRFIAAGKIVSMKGRRPESERIFSAKPGDPLEQLPLIVLVDDGSASASEIVAGALKDHRRALLVGVRTYGKGSVQNVFELGNGQALKLTTAKYYTPSGKPIEDRQGIVPDIYVPMPRELLLALRNQEREDKLRGVNPLAHLMDEEIVPAVTAPPGEGGDQPDETANGNAQRRTRQVDLQLKDAVNILKLQLPQATEAAK